MDLGTYCVNAARLLSGKPVRAFGEAIRGPGGVDERFVGLLSFPDDVVALFDAGMDLPRRGSLSVGGTFVSAVGCQPRTRRGGRTRISRTMSPSWCCTGP